ncbi:hypothetical protein ACFXI6_14375 [Streptomyces mirabilis]|uniref:hypothetical protein n=1 Tax=Streptomyces mirabilis TaxID=68239 RepID=UPI00368FA8F0
MDRDLIQAVAAELTRLSRREPGEATFRILLGGLPVASAFDCWHAVDLSAAGLHRAATLLEVPGVTPRLAPVLQLRR